MGLPQKSGASRWADWRPKKPRAKGDKGRVGLLCDDPSWRTKFLQTLLETEGDVTKAAAAAGIAPIVAYQAKRRDPDFELDWIEIRELVEERRADAIEASVAERAVTGSPRTRYDRDGNVVEESTDHDTPAALGLLKAYRPERFRDKPEPGNRPGGFTTLVEVFSAWAEMREKRAAALAPALPSAPPIETAPLIVSEREN